MVLIYVNMETENLNEPTGDLYTYYRWEWLNTWVNELHDMGRISREAMLVELAAVETINEQAQGTLERKGATRETARRSGQACQVVAQLGVVAFDRKCVGFAHRNFVSAPVIPKTIISLECVAVILLGLRRSVDQLLDDCLSAFPDHFPAQITARLSVYEGEDVDPVFLWPIKVKSSSISASFTSSGMGASGKWAAWALTHKETVR